MWTFMGKMEKAMQPHWDYLASQIVNVFITLASYSFIWLSNDLLEN